MNTASQARPTAQPIVKVINGPDLNLLGPPLPKAPPALVRDVPALPQHRPVPSAGPLRERFHVRNMRLRYYRRVIECRDGLVSLSPYMAQPNMRADTPDQTTELVRDAFTRLARGDVVAAPAVIAAPASATMEADTDELLRLSRALVTQHQSS